MEKKSAAKSNAERWVVGRQKDKKLRIVTFKKVNNEGAAIPARHDLKRPPKTLNKCQFIKDQIDSIFYRIVFIRQSILYSKDCEF